MLNELSEGFHIAINCSRKGEVSGKISTKLSYFFYSENFAAKSLLPGASKLNELLFG